MLLRLYGLPAHLVSDLVDLEERAVEEPKEKDLATLYSDGVEYWKNGDISQALAHLFAIRHHVPNDDDSRILRQKALQAFAVFAHDLGKIKLAKQLIEDLLCEPPDASLIPQTLILASNIWRDLGSHQIALALLNQAETHLPTDDHQRRAWLHHQQAKLLLAAGDLQRAERTLDRALRRYRKVKDTAGESRALIVRVQVFEAQGNLAAALACARKVLRKATQGRHDLSVLSGRLELGRLLIESDAPAAGAAELHKLVSHAATIQDKIAEFYGHYYLWKAYVALGEQDRMRFEFQAASYFVDFMDETTPQAREIRELKAAGKKPQRSIR
jgi:tetratricopeptide (TPR) repeat protein